MIYKNRRATAWKDDVANLIEAAREADGDLLDDVVVVRSERTGCQIVVDQGVATSDDQEVREAALDAGYWIEKEPFGDGWYILFDWSRDPNNPPSNRAIHRQQTAV